MVSAAFVSLGFWVFPNFAYVTGQCEATRPDWTVESLARLIHEAGKFSVTAMPQSAYDYANRKRHQVFV